MKVYLAGPINGCTDAEANDWRSEMRRLLPNHTIVDPMVRDYRGIEDQNFEDIVENDLKDINSVDVVVVNAERPSWGTAMEIVYSWRAEVYVIVVIPEGVRISPWLRYHSDDIVNNLE